MTTERPARRGRIALAALLALSAAACAPPMRDRVADTADGPRDASPAEISRTAPTDAGTTSPTTDEPHGVEPRALEPRAGAPDESATPAPATTTSVEVTYDTEVPDTTVTATVTAGEATVASVELEPGETHTFEGLEAGTYTIEVEERSSIVEDADVGLGWSYRTHTEPLVVRDGGAGRISARCATNEGCTLTPTSASAAAA
ncbi:MAG: hypothetical protein S0880_13505 [Actinomycetota bacterium]|nr:hypothetical protein [Actinomycetota bacterium]